ncbi:hypothetical protein LOZ12_000788 [Ophidiomyces ophidiicola]|uniref:Uncharacterized protein n=1 Tax=Ophidiomyces ophidiicola TaxID=1387563 RepID=A0ACB8V293_9EURO|nr:uncharacterized protein LOZ57_005445 [Ophidiomyces ophidiicola]KAI1924404.1 hypothetical protein LOZ64_000729 [Ophidiomyces ophidiicola]KAI1929305.1 hypothetical protein LOZ60_001774 [Ophidiomyces ophidiicola]KAI1942222.1 hypothetical protein LOZ57_005445 [Ophidiomyces ophidiicola]KAI1974971.1 hypothetical protein LOZ56_000999 [Ophidiomyces ophidiicola]KAI2015591.1 hypothetical protein LOZ49_000613 [Ophidiomyces ophidiicola]
MTAVASPPSVQSGPRIGWYPTSNGGQGGFSSINGDEVSRPFMIRKSVQRTNSSSSISSTSSSSTSTVRPQPLSNGGPPQPTPESNNAGPAKKQPRYIWSGSKAEPVSAVTNARPQAVSAPPTRSAASSAMSALQQPSPVVPSPHGIAPPQQNGVRGPNRPAPSEPTAILSLVPLNGTFERKQITVPYFPDVLRMGRQTNAKTVPSAVNGYFDSKVLSRQHADIWADRQGKIWIRDVKSSNGTFVNGHRLSPENRESEPHELREHDTLELGIDIVSEDQKSIVHHKVSARVEHAGVYGPHMNILDLNFGDIDPTSGGGLFPHHLSQPLNHTRTRQSSTSSAGSSRTATGTNGPQLNALQQQRQMNYWLSPISIEQVVKKLTVRTFKPHSCHSQLTIDSQAEMKQAKYHTQDLTKTNDFVSHLASRDGLEKERIKPSPTDALPASRQINGRPKVHRNDSFSRFSEPPAPPPQQPLPEKPDVASRSNPPSVVSSSPLKRSDTEKSRSPANSVRESSQILSLIEALTIAKKELDLQGARVRELEDLLRHERIARETAEERARTIENERSELAPEIVPEPETIKDDDEISVTTVVESVDETEAKMPVEPEPQTHAPALESVTTELQLRLNTLMSEMDEMRKEVDKYRSSAQRAEDDAAQSRKTLAEMVENVRRERAEAAVTSTSELGGLDITSNSNAVSEKGDEPISNDVMDALSMRCRSLSPTRMQELERAAVAFAEERQRPSIFEHSAPYASMIGVVLLGVGIMAYLNGWPKGDR